MATSLYNIQWQFLLSISSSKENLFFITEYISINSKLRDLNPGISILISSFVLDCASLWRPFLFYMEMIDNYDDYCCPHACGTATAPIKTHFTVWLTLQNHKAKQHCVWSLYRWILNSSGRHHHHSPPLSMPLAFFLLQSNHTENYPFFVYPF